jgi:hypothetical protein
MNRAADLIIYLHFMGNFDRGLRQMEFGRLGMGFNSDRQI